MSYGGVDVTQCDEGVRRKVRIDAAGIGVFDAPVEDDDACGDRWMDDPAQRRLSSALDAASDLIGSAVDPAACPFDEFKKFVLSTSSFDRHHGFSSSAMADAALVLRYPFLAYTGEWAYADDRHGGDAYAPIVDHVGTHLDAMPDGWRARFGLELCEDLRNAAWDPDPRTFDRNLRLMHVEQIKEKFGELRFYAGVCGRGNDVIECYSWLSRGVCIRCGTAVAVRVTRGWISPYCINCSFMGQRGEYGRVSEKVASMFGVERAYDAPSGAYDAARLALFVEETNHANGSADVAEFMEGFMWRRFTKDGVEEYDLGDGILHDGAAPNGEPWRVIDVAKSITADYADFEGYVEAGYRGGARFGLGDEGGLGVEIPPWDGGDYPE